MLKSVDKPGRPSPWTVLIPVPECVIVTLATLVGSPFRLIAMTPGALTPVTFELAQSPNGGAPLLRAAVSAHAPKYGAAVAIAEPALASSMPSTKVENKPLDWASPAAVVLRLKPSATVYT